MHACMQLEGRLQDKRGGEQMHGFILKSDRQEALEVPCSHSHLPSCWFRPTLFIDRLLFDNLEEREKNPTTFINFAHILL